MNGNIFLVPLFLLLSSIKFAYYAIRLDVVYSIEVSREGTNSGTIMCMEQQK